LLFYNARWYDPVIGRFISADTIVPQPGNPQSLNRYSYTANNPLRFVDPSGHRECEGASNCNGPDPALPAPPPVPAPSLLCTASVTPQYQGPVYRAAPVYAPDDGWILKYRIYGDADLRLEYVHVSSYATRGALPVMVAGEYRTVYVFDDGATLVFDEPSLSFTVGEGLYAGSEWTPTGGRQTTAGIGFGGADLQLQQNQVMIGLVNPAGVGGGRIGAQFSAPGVRVLATSQAYLVEKGGADAIGQLYLGQDVALEWEKWIPGRYIGGAWVSGARQAAAWANQWPIKVVP